VFRSIVVGTDGSPTATEALKQAADLAARYEAELHIVSGYRAPRDLRVTGAGSRAEEWVISSSDHVAGVLRDARDLVRKHQLTVETHHEEGDAAKALVRTAERVGADLIVVGNRGMRGLRRRFGRSVPDQVSHHATCAVLVLDTT
jgi:nucleotide-binding universal stress UspA family protein